MRHEDVARRIANSIQFPKVGAEKVSEILLLAFQRGLLDGPDEFFELLPFSVGDDWAACVHAAYQQNIFAVLGKAQKSAFAVWGGDWGYNRVAPLLAARMAMAPLGTRIFEAGLAEPSSEGLHTARVRAAAARVSPVYYAEAIGAGVPADRVVEAWLTEVPLEYLLAADVGSFV